MKTVLKKKFFRKSQDYLRIGKNQGNGSGYLNFCSLSPETMRERWKNGTGALKGLYRSTILEETILR